MSDIRATSRNDGNIELSRRNFLSVTGVAACQAAWVRPQQPASKHKAVIQILLVGGPSQLDTWDPKPDAASDIRGPFHTIQTRQPGIAVSELFPRVADVMDKIALIRSMHHDQSPIHETGLHLFNTGHRFHQGAAHPHMGAVAAHQLGSHSYGATWWALPYPIESMGVAIPHGQNAASLGSDCDAHWLHLEGSSRHQVPRSVGLATLPETSRTIAQRYGTNLFGRSCLLARQLVESGARFVTVNMFKTVFNQLSWDMHANGNCLFVTLDDYRDRICPMFDRGFAALIGDLADHGLLDDVLVVAAGEFGRTPRINAAGGRDHWPGCWTILLAGGGVQGGRVVGASDPIAGEPAIRPVSLPELVATAYHVLGLTVVQHNAFCDPSSSGPVAESTTPRPILELF